MRSVLLFIGLFFCLGIFSQRKPSATDTLHISGELKQALVFSLNDLGAFASKTLPDLPLKNNHNELKQTLKGMKGFLLKELFTKAEYPIEKPRELNEFYFVFMASDNYKVVFSWNELFNNPLGDQVFIITELDGKKITEMPERILVATLSDQQTGRRYIKGLKKIEVKRLPKEDILKTSEK